ncbi:AAA family ATPase [Fructobacillus sp. M158]|uniref:ATP-binding protein n=1 Tax=Fructobacillus parabroussonetiae TaxID=2713174 RepID=UPI00200AF33F|nr:AAA family ATPase [Fructobacillus parabroussonetiae]MCK8616931.1 AAA family ATPase [Fructobacillus parabroussonetiae]
MKIEAIQISGFGKWSDVSFETPADFQLITGQNESGKSTLKAFLLGVFFGFPKGRKADQQRYEPRSGARYGGSVTISCQKGTFKVERLGRAKSTLTVTALSNGQTLPNPEAFLKDLFAPLGGADFREIYSFDEAELSQVANLTAGDFDQVLLAYTKPQAQRFLNWANDQKRWADQDFASGKNGKRPLNLANQGYDLLLQKKTAELANYDEYQKLQVTQQNLQDSLHKLEEAKQVAAQQYDEQKALLANWPLFLESLPSDDVNQQARVVDSETSERIVRLDQEGRFLADQQANNQADLARIQQAIKAPAAIDGRRRALERGFADLEEKQERSQELLSAIASVSRPFSAGLPKPLSSAERELLTKKNTGFYWVAAAFLLGGLVSFSLNVWLPVLFFFLALSFSALGYQKGAGKQQILARFHPLDQSGILNAQPALQKAWQQQKDFDNLNQDCQQLTRDLTVDLKEAGLLSEDKQDLSQQEVRRIVREFLAETASESDGQLALQLREALRLQSQLSKQKDEQQEQLHRELAKHGLTTLADFYQAQQASKESARAMDQQQLARQQIGQRTLAELQARYQVSGPAVEKELAEAQEKTAQELQELRVKEGTLRQSLANCQSRLEQLAADGGLVAVEQELANQTAELEEQFTCYLAKQLAEKVVKRTFLGKENDQSQSVLTQASAYLAQLTAGRYQEIQLKKGQLLIAGPDVSTFQAAELSSGSRDLLYLAVRLALATTLQEAEPLPLFIDDAFVHLDERRRLAALSLIQEIATEHQVIYWTFDQSLQAENQITLF